MRCWPCFQQSYPSLACRETYVPYVVQASAEALGIKHHLLKETAFMTIDLTWLNQLALLRCPKPFSGAVAHLSQLHDLR